MASSGSFNSSAFNATDGTRYLTFAWTQTSQSIANNTTTISWTLTGGGTSKQYIYTGSIKLTIAGETVYTHTGTRFKLENGTKVASGTYTFQHADDGTKSFTAYVEGAIYLHDVNCTGTQTFALNTIARASQPSCVTWPEHTQNVGNFGTEISIHMNRKSDVMTHTVRYQFGSQSGTIATGVTTGTKWVIPLSLMNLIPNSTSGSGTIYVDTYNGSTKVGTKSCGFTATVPAGVKPSLSVTLEDTTGTDDIYGSPVKGLSKIKITPAVTVAYSSPIASYVITANGVTYNTATATTGFLTTAGTSKVTVTVNDKRGRSSTWTYDMTVLDYTAPAVSKLTVGRCDADGSENDQGEHARVTFSATVSSMSSKNTATYQLRYKKSVSTAWTTVAISALNNNFSVIDHVYVFAADGNSSYDVELTVTDRHNTAPRSTSVSTAFTMINWHESGNAIRFGGVAEQTNTFQNDLTFNQTGDAHGRIYGLGTLPEIPNGEDFNHFVDIGCFSVRSIASAETIQNMPVKTAGRLIVSTPVGLTDGGNYSYREQIFLPHTSAYGESGWIRLVSMQGTTEWHFGAWNSTALEAYPVGSIYWAFNHTSPASLFGGTWTRITNAFLWATTEGGSIGWTGGESTHTLTVDEMPSHGHTLIRPKWYGADGNGAYSNTYNASTGAVYGTTGSTTAAYKSADTRNDANIQATGGGAAHNNMPPYIQVSAWRRTA